jgi:hypothetical protein
VSLQKLPLVGLDDPNQRRRQVETINNITDFTFDDSRRRTTAEIAAGVTPTNYAYPPGDVRRYGAVGDSNGTTGNGTDDTAAFQAAINYAKQSSGRVFIPSPVSGDFYRITAPLDGTGVAVAFEIAGESMLDTAIFADFTSVSRIAFMNFGNTSGIRSRPHLHDFRIKGRGNTSTSTKVIGIYCEYTSEQTSIQNIYVHGFEDGVMIANDYATKILNLQCVGNFAQGLWLGYKLDGSTTAPSYNISLFGGDYTLNGGWGVYVYGAQAFSSHGSSFQGNIAGQIILNGCEGTALFGTYIEHADDANTPTAQIYIINCNGVGVYGFPCPAFQHDGTPIVIIETSRGVTISDFRPRTTGGPFSAIGIKAFDSTFTLNDSYLSDLSQGISLQNSSIATVNNTQFGNCTTPIIGNASSNKLVWNQALAADVSASSFDALNSIDLHYTDNSKNKVNETKVFNVTVSAAELNAGGKNIITHTLPSERWRIMDIIFFNQTPASGGGGDRNLQVVDSAASSVYATITAANAQAAAAVNRWGSAVVPFPVNGDLYNPVGAALNLMLKNSGGTTNYTTGSFNVTVTAMRTA